MKTDRIARLSQHMSVVTLWIIVAMMVLNAATWIFPPPPSAQQQAVATFSFSNTQLAALGIDLSRLPWWQTLGGIVLSSLPLAALAGGLLRLRALFCSYARGEYLSVTASRHLGGVGHALALWVAASVLCEPLVSFWATMREPVGHRLISVGFGTPYFVALFVAACITVISLILQRASELDAEHRQIV